MEERKHVGVSREYANDQISVSWEPEYCIHTAMCLNAEPDVFDSMRRPWIKIDLILRSAGLSPHLRPQWEDTLQGKYFCKCRRRVSCKEKRRFKDSFGMECGVTRVTLAGDLSGRVLAKHSCVSCCYLLDFALTFATRRFNLREHLIAGFSARLRCELVHSTTHFAPDGF